MAAGLTGLVVLVGCSQPQPVSVPSPSGSVTTTPTPTSTPAPTPTPTPSAATPSASPARVTRDPRYYANLTPYAAPKPGAVIGPRGYQVVFVENISRHGSRSLTSGADSKRALELWDRAAQADALTPRGAGCGTRRADLDQGHAVAGLRPAERARSSGAARAR